MHPPSMNTEAQRAVVRVGPGLRGVWGVCAEVRVAQPQGRVGRLTRR